MNQWAQYRGALLSLPYGGSRKDVIDTKMFQNCFKENVKKWFRWSKKLGLAVESIEDLILVTGRTLVTSWGIGAFEVRIPVDSDLTTIFPKARTLDGSRGFFCRNSYGNVEYHNSRFHLVSSPCCLLAVNLCFVHRTRMFKNLYLRTNASLSGAFVQSALCSGRYECVLYNTWPRALSVNINNKSLFLYFGRFGCARTDRSITRSEPSEAS